MVQDNGANIATVMRQIPCGLFVLTAAHDADRSGVLTRWVQPCSLEPPLIMVAVEEGLPIQPIIRDSRSFALCQISCDDLLLKRTFASPPARGEDPFVTLPATPAPSGAPIIERSLAFIDCEVMRHVDLDADHRLYVGIVRHAAVMKAGCSPAIEVNGQPAGGARQNGAPSNINN